MTARRRLVSAFVIWHVLAIVLVALPAPDSRGARRAGEDGFRERIARGLDIVALAVGGAVDAVRRVTQIVQPPVDFYIGATGMAQQWAMFSNPPRYDQYVRVRAYLKPVDGRVWTTTELVMPAGREDRVRLLKSFRESYSDKAFAIALAEFYRRREPALVRPDTRPEDLPADLAPILRYFTRRLAGRQLPGTSVVRTEFWVGNANATPPGVAPDPAELLERHSVLAAYYDGPVEERFSVRPIPPYHAVEREADISWILEYFEEP